MLVYKNMLSEVMSWREAPLKFSSRVTAARGTVSTNPTGPWSVDALVSGCRPTVLPRCQTSRRWPTAHPLDLVGL